MTRSLFFLLLVFLLTGCRSQQDAYYRGVYEACVRTSVIQGRTTSFDLLACQELEGRARREEWFEQRVVISE